jgi:hypothetical protein
MFNHQTISRRFRWLSVMLSQDHRVQHLHDRVDALSFELLLHCAK